MPCAQVRSCKSGSRACARSARGGAQEVRDFLGVAFDQSAGRPPGGGIARVDLARPDDVGVAVATFLDRRIRFPEISRLVEAALDKNERPGPQSIEDVFEIDREVRRDVTLLIEERCV